ncbi:hypothetical protein WHI96_08020 [Pseudonocardia tropica]|uniref:Uncharacterized protein n=1 Tax=Pseudonocardia tropica TaxID=681289 RepID=A0ABV1JS58_9PSEU
MTGSPARSGQDRARDAQNKFVRTPESIARDAECLRLRSRGETWKRISDLLGYGGGSNAKKAADRANRDVLAGPVEDYRNQQLMRIQAMRREALKVLERDHVVVSHGRVILSGPPPEEGQPDTRTPMLDDGPKLQAIQTLRQLDEREAKLLGLDAPTKADVTVHKVDPQDLELAELINEAKAKNAAERERIEGGS